MIPNKKLCLVTLMTIFLTQLSWTQPHASHIREADVMWSTKIWREIDLRQKINQPLYYPLQPSDGYMSLFDAILKEIEEGYITAYSTGPMGQRDDFSVPLSAAEVKALITTSDTIWTEDPDTEQYIPQVVDDSIESEDVMRYRVKEEWIFERQHSTMRPRILGLAPMVAVYGEDGAIRGLKTLFWIRFDQARYGLTFYPVYLRHNDNKDLNYTDIFVKRFFNSYIIKESNVPDRYINEYARGMDALLESDRIEEEIRTLESDLWEH